MTFKRKGRPAMRLTSLLCAASLVAPLVITGHAAAEDRKFSVMLAHSPKAFVGGGIPGLPPGGLFNVETINKDYFDTSDPDIDSFIEYWEEISYGDVIVTGKTFGWVSLPWAFEPNQPNAPTRPSPADFINLRLSRMTSEGTFVPEPFAYGAGEDFCDTHASGDSSFEVGPADCGALIITDLVGTPPAPLPPPPQRGPGMSDFAAARINVWTPGERFLDVDGDNRWDGIDEGNDMMCHGPDGCTDICAPSVCEFSGALCDTSPLTSSSSRVECPQGEKCVVARGRCSVGSAFCATDAHCPSGTCDAAVASERACNGTVNCSVVGETCGDPEGSGPRGCDKPGCGDLGGAATDFDGDGFNNDGNCVVAERIPCDTRNPCAQLDANTPGACLSTGLCLATNCIPETGNVELPDCCDQDDPEQRADCVAEGGLDIDSATRGITCGTLIPCCEFATGGGDDGDNVVDVPEPFEDYMIRWEPSGRSSSAVWVIVDSEYVRNNYPGDAEALIRRTGNGYYDSPDLFMENGNTKMMQDAGDNRFAWRTPKPGKRKLSGSPLVFNSAYETEESWFDPFWTDRYGSTVPPWPGGDSPDVGLNSPLIRPFDPDEPVPPVVGGTPGRRWFQSNRGGWNGRGRGTGESDRFVRLDLGTDDPTGTILPEETFGYYDGWVEHDDLASSKYHSQGDKRLGEITSPSLDTLTIPGTSDGSGTAPAYTAIFGADLGLHNPNSVPILDNFCVAAGPGAINIHGEKGFDAGDVCIVEWLTWRTDGTSQTIATQWEVDNGRYHPFAGPRRCDNNSLRTCTSDANCLLPGKCTGGSLGVGFRDYNLDGMIDQGEARPELSENYSVDSDPFTNPNNGNTEITNYPFNRLRMVEDVVEALDSSVDWKDFVDDNRVSGIVLVPPDAYSDVNLFPLAPRYYPIHTQDRGVTFFHDLVICQDCRDFPSATPYAAHEYGHTWEDWPDLYDYERLEGDTADSENCPIGLWDIMADSRLVHPVPVLKNRSGWVQPIDLETVLEPGVVTTITLPPAEFERENSYYFIKNVDRTEERFYFWSAGSGFDERFPGKGMLIMHTFDFDASQAELALQQRTPPFLWSIIQADGLGHLEACAADGNNGDFGDLWPGSTNARKFNRDTVPSARWTEFGFWSGLDISNIETSGNGTVTLTLTWVPTTRPVARVKVTPVPVGSPATTTGPDPFVVTFDAGDSVSFDKPGDALEVTVDWVWGDGETSPGLPITPPVEHTYAVGTYHPTATFKDTAGRQASWTGPTIEAVEYQPPTAIFSVNPSEGVPGETEFEFDGTASTSSDGAIARFDWDFGDGAVEDDGDSIVTHMYDREGPPSGYEVRLTVTDSRGTSASATKSLVVLAPPNNLPPIAQFNFSPTQPEIGEEVRFDAGASTDPNGDSIRFEWDFGDDSDPVSTLAATVFHKYREAGNFTVQLTVRDQFGTPTILSRPITVITPVGNRAPIAIIATGPRAAGVGSALTFDGRLSFDPNGDEMEFLWTFTLNGVIVDTMTGSVVTKLFDVAGTYSVVLEVSDDAGLVGVTDPETVVITAGGPIFEPPPSDPLPGGDSGEPADSALQRPIRRICGFGMIMSLFGSLAGLWSMAIARRRVRGSCEAGA